MVYFFFNFTDFVIYRHIVTLIILPGRGFDGAASFWVSAGCMDGSRGVLEPMIDGELTTNMPPVLPYI